MSIITYLFILCVELLIIAIRTNKCVQDIKVGETWFKITQLADDNTCVSSDEKSGNEVLNIIQNFKYCSGLKHNLNKTEAIWTESHRNFPKAVFKKNGHMTYFIHSELG